MGKKEETSNTVARRGRSTRMKKVDQQESQTQNREGEEVSVDLEEDEEEEIDERPSTRGSRRGKSTVNVEVTANRTTRAGRGRKKKKTRLLSQRKSMKMKGILSQQTQPKIIQLEVPGKVVKRTFLLCQFHKHPIRNQMEI